MNLCVRLKVLWTEDEIKIKSVSIGGEDISSMQNFPSLARGGKNAHDENSVYFTNY